MVILSNKFEILNEIKSFLGKDRWRNRHMKKKNLDKPKNIKEMDLATYAKTNPKGINDSSVKNVTLKLFVKNISKYFLYLVVIERFLKQKTKI